MLSHLINLEGIFILAVTVLIFFKLQFRSCAHSCFRRGRWVHSLQEVIVISHPIAFHIHTRTLLKSAPQHSQLVVPQVLSQLCSPAHPCTWAQSLLTIRWDNSLHANHRCQEHKCLLEAASSSEIRVLKLVYKSMAVTAAECSEISVFTWG